MNQTEVTQSQQDVPVEIMPDRALENRGTLGALLNAYRGKLEAVLPRHMTMEKLEAVAILALSKNHDLLRCTQYSVVHAIIKASELGLDFGGSLGQGWLIPYGKECQFIPGYKGLCDLARRSEKVDIIEATMVYENDHFKMQRGTDPKIDHIPVIKGERGAIIGAYAVAELRDARAQFEFMRIDEIDAIEDKSPAAKSKYSPWSVKAYRPQMQKKTVIRRLLNYLPLSPEVAAAIEHDNIVDGVVLPEQESKIEMPKSIAESNVSRETLGQDANDSSGKRSLPEAKAASGNDPPVHIVMGMPQAKGDFWLFSVELEPNADTVQVKIEDRDLMERIVSHADIRGTFEFILKGKGKTRTLEDVIFQDPPV